MDVTAAHWIYLAGVMVIIAVMILRKNVVVPAVAATFFTAWAFTGSFPAGLSSVFNASLTAASELFNIFLIIALITALLGSLRALEADKRMIIPFQRIMRNGSLAFVIVFAVTYVISLFFWPTPAVPLIGAILLPAAIRAGLPAMGAAMAMAIAGQGMALSSDYVIQVAPGLSAVSAGVDTAAVADRAMILSLITGGIAIILAFLKVRGGILAPSETHLTRWENTGEDGTLHTAQDGHESSAEDMVAAEGTLSRRADTNSGDGGTVDTENEARRGDRVPTSGKDDAPTLSRFPAGDVTLQQGRIATRSKAFAVLVPAMFAALVGYMLLGKFTDLVEESTGGNAAGLVGGTAALLLIAVTMTNDGRDCLETSATHVVDGLVFAFKAMGIVIPIAGFFFIGNSDFAGRIMSLDKDVQAPGFLLDLVSQAQHAIPDYPVLMGIGILLVGMATGLDGSGFSGLPLTGSFAGTLGPVSSVDTETLAAIGQMGSIWTGGGTLIAWSSLLAVAGFAKVPVIELARRLFLPVVTGLVVATVAGVLLL